MDFAKPASTETLSKVASALNKNGITVDIVENKDAAKNKTIDLIPQGSQIMTMTSITLEQTGIKKTIESSGNYQPIRKLLEQTEDKKQKKQLAAVPEWSISSVHAITESGQILIASNTGSQLPAAAYGAEHVIFVVGTQKIVKNLEQGFERINSYILPLESARSRKAYNLPESWNSFPSKILIIQKEPVEGRIHVIFVKEPVGY